MKNNRRTGDTTVWGANETRKKHLIYYLDDNDDAVTRLLYTPTRIKNSASYNKITNNRCSRNGSYNGIANFKAPNCSLGTPITRFSSAQI